MQLVILDTNKREVCEVNAAEAQIEYWNLPKGWAIIDFDAGKVLVWKNGALVWEFLQ